MRKRYDTVQDYTVNWYCIQRADGECFPDGRPVPNLKRSAFARSPRKLVWVKLGDGKSWHQAITFGPTVSTTEEAAEDFGAAKVVWLEPVQKNAYCGRSRL